MCGIAGIIYKNKEIKDLDINHLSKILNHRGPEVSGNYISKNKKCALFHNRLKIIDLSSDSNQPYVNDNNILVYNGEIYNYRDLIKFLNNEISISSDTIALSKLSLLKNFNEVVAELRGMFSIGLFNEKDNKLSLYRDFFGIKPLFYYFDEEVFIFASEKKFITKALKNDPKIDNLNHYFEIGYNLGNQSIYSKIKSVTPGNNLILDQISWKIKINQISFRKKIKTNKNFFSTDLKKHIRNSINKHLIADKKFTVLQSSGHDSNLIISEIKKNYDSLDTYSIAFKDSNFNEYKEIEKINYKNKINNIKIEFSQNDFLEIFDKYNLLFDEPFFDPSSVVMIKLFSEVKKKYDIALSGDGGDELFLSYIRHKSIENKFLKYFFNFNFSKHKYMKNLLSIFIKLFGYKNVSHKVEKLINYYVNDDKFKVFYQNINPTYLQKDIFKFQNNSIEEIAHFDISTYLPNNILFKSDLVSMINSVELRVPFLDLDIYNFLRSYDFKFLKKNLNKKKLFQEMMNENSFYYPSSPKRGFDIPISEWVDAILKNYKIEQNLQEKVPPLFNLDFFNLNLNIKKKDERNNKFLYNRLIYLKWSNLI